MEDLKLRDEQLIDPKKVNPEYYDYDHKYTTDLWECYEFIHELREYIDKHSIDQKNHEKWVVRVVFDFIDLIWFDKPVVSTNFSIRLQDGDCWSLHHVELDHEVLWNRQL